MGSCSFIQVSLHREKELFICVVEPLHKCRMDQNPRPRFYKTGAIILLYVDFGKSSDSHL